MIPRSRPACISFVSLLTADSSNSDQSSRGLGSFIEQRKNNHTLMEEFYEHRCDSPAKFDESIQDMLKSNIYQPKGMSQSRSEGNILHRPPSPHIKTRFDLVLPETRAYHARTRSESNPLQNSSVRGRVAVRTPSPAKLDDIVENRIADFSTSPVKRSRSPVKQLFGERGWLGRSTSMKELPSEEYRKTGFKHWGERFKQKVGEIVCPEKVSSFYRKGYSLIYQVAENRGGLQVVSLNICPTRNVLQSATPIQIPNLPQPTRASQTLLGSRAHDLRHRQPIPDDASASRAHVHRIPPKSDPILDLQEPPASRRIPIRPTNPTRPRASQPQILPLLRRARREPHHPEHHDDRVAHHGQGDERAHLLHPGQRHPQAAARLLQDPRDARRPRRDVLGVSGDPGASPGDHARTAEKEGYVCFDAVWLGEEVGTPRGGRVGRVVGESV